MSRLNETHTTCLKCLKKSEIIPYIPGLLHKTIVCDECKEKQKNKVSPNN